MAFQIIGPVVGEVKWWNDRKGSGYIAVDGIEVQVYRTALPNSKGSLKEWEKVELIYQKVTHSVLDRKIHRLCHLLNCRVFYRGRRGLPYEAPTDVYLCTRVIPKERA